MNKSPFDPHPSLPADPVKRVEEVVAVCIDLGYVNRDVLANHYGLSQLQASILLREFLQVHSNDVHSDTEHGAYVLIEYPSKRNSIKM